MCVFWFDKLAPQKSSDVLAKVEGEDVVSRFSLKLFSFQGIDIFLIQLVKGSALGKNGSQNCMVLLNPPLLVRTARVAEVEVRLTINVSLKLFHIGELRSVVCKNDREQLMERIPSVPDSFFQSCEFSGDLQSGLVVQKQGEEEVAEGNVEGE